LPLRPARDTPLVAAVAVVRDAVLGVVPCPREGEAPGAPVLGWYVLTDARAGLWRHGLRYRWRVDRTAS
jgi:hypothetical protein